MSEHANNQPPRSMDDVEKTMSAIEGVVKILGPLDSDERQRVIQSALLILRESFLEPTMAASSEEPRFEQESGSFDISPKARLWARQNGLSQDQLSHVFDISEGAATVIASGILGKNNPIKTIKSYVLTGIAAFLTAGEPQFLDKDARSLCEHFGCYDRTNHAKYMKDKGNYFVGDKDRGWKLTAPGLKYGAELVKEMIG
jgi:hypothetical protein